MTKPSAAANRCAVKLQSVVYALTARSHEEQANDMARIIDAEFAPLVEAISATAGQLHHAANGGLDMACRKATASELKTAMREYRDQLRSALAALDKE
jgi:hypothetical protein